MNNINFEEMKLKDIIKIDLDNVVEKLIIPNKDRISYDNETKAWYIGGEEIVDELWYDCYTIVHPKEIIGYIDEYIENELKLKK